MLYNLGKKLAAVVLVIGLLSVIMGGVFVQVGFDKSNLLKQTMTEQKITYGGAGGSIEGIIDTAQEAQIMADILQEHVREYGSYSEMDQDDPNRQTVLNALTMTASLELAVMGFGLTDVVKANGAFMVLIGFALIIIAVPALRQKARTG